MYTEHEEELLAKLLDHRTLKKSPSSIKLLKTLRERGRASQGVALIDLTKSLFPKEDAKADNVKKRLHTLIYRVRGALKDIYNDTTSDFQQEPRPEIEAEGELYWLRFDSADSHPYLAAFWRPYLACSPEHRQIQTSDRFFLRLGSHLYFRDVTSPVVPDWLRFLQPLCEQLGLMPEDEDPEESPLLKKLSPRIHELEQLLVDQVAEALGGFLNRQLGTEIAPADARDALVKRFRPSVSRHYVSAGEAVGLTHIAELFQMFQKAVKFGNREGTTTDRASANIIQVGKPRHNGMLRKLLDAQRFVCGQDRIRERDNPARFVKDAKDTHVDEPTVFRAGSTEPPPSLKYALVSRFENRETGPDQKPYVVTSIVSSHGRVTEAACRYLVNEASMASLFQQLGLDLRSIPETFQFVLEANVYRGVGENRTTAEITRVKPDWIDWPVAAQVRGMAKPGPASL